MTIAHVNIMHTRQQYVKRKKRTSYKNVTKLCLLWCSFSIGTLVWIMPTRNLQTVIITLNHDAAPIIIILLLWISIK